MVSALSRDIHKTTWEQSQAVNVRLAKVLDDAGETIEKVNFFPCALREFVNSNADLPTIEELAQKSQALARVMGMTS